MKEIKNFETWIVHQRFWSIYKTILSYCLKCIDSKNPIFVMTKNGRIMLLLKK